MIATETETAIVRGRKLTDDQEHLIMDLIDKAYTYAEIANMVGCHRRTVYAVNKRCKPIFVNLAYDATCPSCRRQTRQVTNDARQICYECWLED